MKSSNASEHSVSVNANPVVQRFYPEVAVAGFSHVDAGIAFYTQVAALLKPEHRVLDFGAGRGEPIADDPVPFRRGLVTLKGRCKHVEGCDVSPAVLENPYLDGASVLEPDGHLPYPSDHFDLIVSRYVFEHIEDPVKWADELMRVLKPGGWLCAITPNGFGYVALAARMVPNRLHARLLERVQPGRKAEDVFPTRYRLNSKRDLERHFGPHGKVHVFRTSSEPAYHFGRASLFWLFKTVHKILPDVLHTGLCVFVRKDDAAVTAKDATDR